MKVTRAQNIAGTTTFLGVGLLLGFSLGGIAMWGVPVPVAVIVCAANATLSILLISMTGGGPAGSPFVRIGFGIITQVEDDARRITVRNGTEERIHGLHPEIDEQLQPGKPVIFIYEPENAQIHRLRLCSIDDSGRIELGEEHRTLDRYAGLPKLGRIVFNEINLRFVAVSSAWMTAGALIAATALGAHLWHWGWWASLPGTAAALLSISPLYVVSHPVHSVLEMRITAGYVVKKERNVRPYSAWEEEPWPLASDTVELGAIPTSAEASYTTDQNSGIQVSFQFNVGDLVALAHNGFMMHQRRSRGPGGTVNDDHVTLGVRINANLQE